MTHGRGCEPFQKPRVAPQRRLNVRESVMHPMRRMRKVTDMCQRTSEVDVAAQFLEIASAEEDAAFTPDGAASGVLDDFARCAVVKAFLVGSVIGIKAGGKVKGGHASIGRQFYIMRRSRCGRFGRYIAAVRRAGRKRQERCCDPVSPWSRRADHRSDTGPRVICRRWLFRPRPDRPTISTQSLTPPGCRS